MHLTILKFSSQDPEQSRKEFKLGEDSRDWQVESALKDVQAGGRDMQKIVPILCRPFDTRYTYYTGKTRGFHALPRPQIMRHMLLHNMCLITSRKLLEKGFTHCLAANTIINSRVIAGNIGMPCVFPLYLYLFPDPGQNSFDMDFMNNSITLPRVPNIHPNVYKALVKRYGVFSSSLAEQIFYWCYGILYSRVYRERFAGALAQGLPRVPFPRDYDLFLEITRLGEALVSAHLLIPGGPQESDAIFPTRGNNIVQPSETRFSVSVESPQTPGSGPVESPGYVYINRKQYFANIPKEVWDYKMCGYLVLQGWLKSRKGLKLKAGDIDRFKRMVRSLKTTLHCQKEIDRLYPFTSAKKMMMKF